jgi:hypothetical protein
MGIEIILSLVGAGVAILGVAATYFGVIGKLTERLVTVETLLNAHLKETFGIMTKITAIETKLGDVNFPQLATRMEIFWGAVEPVIRSMIKQPIHFRKDDLIDRFPNLTDDELCELKNILEEEMKDLTTNKDPKVLAYALMMARVDTVLHENNKKC